MPILSLIGCMHRMIERRRNGAVGRGELVAEVGGR